MNGKIRQYLDNCFAARALPAIAWGAFLPFLIRCVQSDGGTWHEIHRYFEMPPSITGGHYECVSAAQIFQEWWKQTKQ